ncbi:MAG: type VI secretion system baseplate subunit TssF [Granulosicoccus sp.]|nr:type VI secretion system baseplate subunit TssF [Granulosicoccus sp.]
MNPKLLENYRRELLHMREMGGQFAEEFPKIAGRLGLDTLDCSDPYVERLLEGFAFMAARVDLKIESSYSKLARHLLEMVYPSYLSPTPSMLIAEFQPSLQEGSLADGFLIERGTKLRSQPTPDTQTECDFRTSHDLTLWPIELAELRVLSSRAAIQAAGVNAGAKVRSALGISLRTTDGTSFSELPLDTLSMYLCGPDNAGAQLYEQIFRHTKGVAVTVNGKAIARPGQQPTLGRQGFEDDEALLPVHAKNFQGKRLVTEYFAFPDRFRFMKLRHLQRFISRCDDPQIEILFLFDNSDDALAELYSEENIKLNCVPAINLFPKSADRIHLDRKNHEYHVVADRTKPLDFEVYSVDEVKGVGNNQSESQDFHAYYHVNEKRRTANAFFQLHREPRELSSKQKRRGPRASYIGSEVFISIVDGDEAPYRSDLRQLSVRTLCTNRDLPLQMPVGRGQSDFTLDIGAPVESIKCLSGPTVPKPSRTHAKDPWKLVNNLNVNYLSICGAEGEGGEAAAATLRQMLELYIDEQRGADKRQLDGIVSIQSKPVVRQRRYRSHVEIAHGVEIEVTVDDSAFEGVGVYLLGSVLECFFARYTSINSFTETVLTSIQRNEIERWPVRLGTRKSL